MQLPTVALGALLCVGLPLGSWLFDGRGGLAFTMYAATVSYRLEAATIDDRGARTPTSLTDIAGNVSFDAAAPFLAGADVYRTVPQIDALRAHLREIARAACSVRQDAHSAEITLLERSPSSLEVRRTERVACRRHD